MSYRDNLKIVIIGNLGTGKTAYVCQYTKKTFLETYKPTKDSEFGFKIFEDEGKLYRIQIYDITGQDKRIAKIFGEGAQGFIVISDATNIQTREEAIKWKSALDEVTKFFDGGKLPCILVESKCDLMEINENENYDDSSLKAFAESNGFDGAFLASSKNGYNIDKSMTFLLKTIIKRMKDIPIKKNEFLTIEQQADNMVLIARKLIDLRNSDTISKEKKIYEESSKNNNDNSEKESDKNHNIDNNSSTIIKTYEESQEKGKDISEKNLDKIHNISNTVPAIIKTYEVSPEKLNDSNDKKPKKTFNTSDKINISSYGINNIEFKDFGDDLIGIYIYKDDDKIGYECEVNFKKLKEKYEFLKWVNDTEKFIDILKKLNEKKRIKINLCLNKILIFISVLFTTFCGDFEEITFILKYKDVEKEDLIDKVLTEMINMKKDENNLEKKNNNSEDDKVSRKK